MQRTLAVNDGTRFNGLTSALFFNSVQVYLADYVICYGELFVTVSTLLFEEVFHL